MNCQTIPSNLIPAVYLNQAGVDYARLVPTHPMEKSEWDDALGTCRHVVADLIYDGKWPDPLPPPPDTTPEVGEPDVNGGQTRSEQVVSDDFANFWTSLPASAHVAATATAVHTLQSCLQSRILRRLYPNYWASTPGSLALDAQREQERWNLARP